MTTIEAEDGDVSARITRLVSMDGDVDVSQRKGKVIAMFDVKLVLEFEGSTPEQSDVSGTITVPEVAHDTDKEDYVVGRLNFCHFNTFIAFTVENQLG